MPIQVFLITKLFLVYSNWSLRFSYTIIMQWRVMRIREMLEGVCLRSVRIVQIHVMITMVSFFLFTLTEWEWCVWCLCLHLPSNHNFNLYKKWSWIQVFIQIPIYLSISQSLFFLSHLTHTESFHIFPHWMQSIFFWRDETHI